MALPHRLRGDPSADGETLFPLTLFKANEPQTQLNITDALLKGMGEEWGEKFGTRVQMEFANKLGSIQNKLATLSGREAPLTPLTENEIGAIFYYTVDTERFGGKKEFNPYFVINKALVARKLAIVQPWKDFVWYLTAGLSKLPDFKGTVYRAIDIPVSSNPKQYIRGKVVVWVSFTSTSQEQTKINGFYDSKNKIGTLMSIHVTKGKDISIFSAFNEKEVLLPMNSKMRIEELIPTEIKNFANTLIPEKLDIVTYTQLDVLPVENPQITGENTCPFSFSQIINLPVKLVPNSAIPSMFSCSYVTC